MTDFSLVSSVADYNDHGHGDNIRQRASRIFILLRCTQLLNRSHLHRSIASRLILFGVHNIFNEFNICWPPRLPPTPIRCNPAEGLGRSSSVRRRIYRFHPINFTKTRGSRAIHSSYWIWELAVIRLMDMWKQDLPHVVPLLCCEVQ